MQRRAFLATAAVTVAALSQATWAAADANLVKQVEPLTDKAMAAYNAKDWKAFYAGYADMMKGIATEQAFKTLYIDNYHKNFGTLKSKTLNQAQSVLQESPGVANGLLVYDVVCSQKKGMLAVNLFKENGKWKLQQIQFK